MNHYPYWWEDAAPQSATHQEVESACDVAIVGAGYTGLTAALTLAKAGKSVQVFDKDKVGAGASSRNGGITSGSLRLSLSKAIEQYGEEKACELFTEARTARQHLKNLITEHKIECDYSLSGLFTVIIDSPTCSVLYVSDRWCCALSHQLSGGNPLPVDHVQPGTDNNGNTQ